MATKRGLCPYCQGKRIDHRIFQVNPEASTCFCPVCMKEMEPLAAISTYSKYIDDMLLKADNTLFIACDPSLAYQEYADVLELEPKEAHALIGRILCLIYMGKVRTSYLKEAYILLENTSYRGCDLTTFVNFLEKMNTALDEYEYAINKRLTFKEHYYDEECLRLYWSHLADIIKMKELILSIFVAINKNKENEKILAFINLLEISIDEKKRILDLESRTVDGSTYHLDHFFNGKPFIVKTSQGDDSRFKRYRLSTLDPEEKGKRLIKDKIFRDYTAVIKLSKVSIIMWVLLFLLVAGAGVGAYLFKNNTALFITFIGLGAVLMLGAVVIFAFSLYWRSVLKKRELKLK